MALTNAEKQAAHRARQREALDTQAGTIADQQQTIAAMQKQIEKLTAQVQTGIEERHALEIKLLKLQAAKRK